MGKIKKILENELIGGTQSTDIYPVTSVKAVYDENNERLDHILSRRSLVNISTNYNEDHSPEVLTLAQAINKVPQDDRVLGFVGTFLSPNGWVMYRFTGENISEWTNISNWVSTEDYFKDIAFVGMKADISTFTPYSSTFSAGLLRTDGTVDTSHAEYYTSDFIALDHTKAIVYLSEHATQWYARFTPICLYDENKVFIGYVNNGTINIGYNQLYPNYYAKYARFSIETTDDRNKNTLGTCKYVSLDKEPLTNKQEEQLNSAIDIFYIDNFAVTDKPIVNNLVKDIYIDLSGSEVEGLTSIYISGIRIGGDGTADINIEFVTSHIGENKYENLNISFQGNIPVSATKYGIYFTVYPNVYAESSNHNWQWNLNATVKDRCYRYPASLKYYIDLLKSSDIKDIQDRLSGDNLFPFGNKFKKIQTNLYTGLLRVGGNVDESYVDFRVSDYIELDSTKRTVYYYNPNSITIVTSDFLLVAYYDKDKKYINGLVARNSSAPKAYDKTLLLPPPGAKYVRYSLSGGESQAQDSYGIFSATVSSIIGEFENIHKLIESVDNQAVKKTNVVGGVISEPIQLTYNLNKRWQDSTLIDATGFVCAEQPVESNIGYYVTCVGSKYVPGVIMFDSNDNVIGSMYTNDTYAGERFISEYTTFPANVAKILLQANNATEDNMSSLLSLKKITNSDVKVPSMGILDYKVANQELTGDDFEDISLDIKVGWHKGNVIDSTNTNSRYAVYKINDANRHYDYYVSIRENGPYYACVRYLDVTGVSIGTELVGEDWTQKLVENYKLNIPDGTSQIILNSYFKSGNYAKVFSLKRKSSSITLVSTNSLDRRVEELSKTGVGDWKKQEGEDFIPKRGWYKSDGSITNDSEDTYGGFEYIKFDYTPYINKKIAFTGYGDGPYYSMVLYFNSDDLCISQEWSIIEPTFENKLLTNYVLNVPDGTSYIVFNGYRKGYESGAENPLALTVLDEFKLVTENYINDVFSEFKEKRNTYWANKNIWWCGTSIPAAGFWNINNTWSYPYITGQILDAKKVYNEAVGSSCASGSMNMGSYEVVSRRMGHTIAQKLQICDDLWTIDDANKTFTAGPRILGITALPTVSTYSDVCYQRYLLLSNGYEIKLIAKYLLKDKEEHDNFLKEKFGDRYDAIISTSPATAYSYQDDIDLFVFDHSNNDSNAGSYDDINSTDITKYVGALNTYVKLIMQYKPHARIVFISNYTNSPTGVIKTEGDIAENWNIPYLNLLNYLPIGNTKFKILTRGYWDENSYWHDSGFTWDDSSETDFTNMNIANMSDRVKGNGSKAQVKANINPQQINGVWYWEGYQRDIWIRDGLHPHTDKSGNCLKLYAQTIAKFLEDVGNGYSD